MIAGKDPRDRLLQQHVRGQREDLLPRRHDLTHHDVAELESAVHQHLLELGNHVQPPRRGGNQLQLLGRVYGCGALRLGHIECTQHHRRRLAQQPHRGADHSHKHQHGRRHRYGQRLSTAQGQGLGHQLAGHYV